MKLYRDLLDPRVLGQPKKSELIDRASEILSKPASDKRSQIINFAENLQTILESGNDDRLRLVLKTPGHSDEKRVLLEALELCVSGSNMAVPLQGIFFAIPVLIVAGGKSSGKLSAVLPKSFDLNDLFEKAGALAYSKNVSFSNILTSLDALEKVNWRYLMRCNKGLDIDDFELNDLKPEDIILKAGTEQVHLRYLIGLAVGSTKAPKFTETAADISKWGIQFTRKFDELIKFQNAELLAIPRRPVNFVRAVYDGIWATNEIGFQLFLSNALRYTRQRTGEPDVTIATYSDNSIRVRFTSVFDDTFDKTFGWRLSPLDEFSRVVDCIDELLSDCGISNIEVIPNILSHE